jgi:hypothetical protein
VLPRAFDDDVLHEESLSFYRLTASSGRV